MIHPPNAGPPAKGRRRAVGLLAVTVLGLAIQAAVSAPASAAAGLAVPGDPTATLQLLGLDVVTHDGFIAASGPAAAVNLAAGLFAGDGDYALFTGPDETGTGYLALTNNNPTEYVELQLPPGVTIASIVNDTTDEVGYYTVAGAEGTLNQEEPPHTTSNLPVAAAARTAAIRDAGAQGAAIGSPGVLSGNVVQVPVHVPVNVCGNTISVIGLLNPAFGNTCVNA